MQTTTPQLDWDKLERLYLSERYLLFQVDHGGWRPHVRKEFVDKLANVRIEIQEFCKGINYPGCMTLIKTVPMKSRVFRKYTALTFTHLEAFAESCGFKIVDRYTSYDPEFKRHMPAIEGLLI